MCHYNYWGYDGCSHELRHMDNRWTLCPLSERMSPRDCPFAAYTRHKIGVPFCESCLDEVPPNHVPVTRIILDFDTLRQAMEMSVDRAACARFVRDYRAGLRRVRESSFVSGPNNNFYNEIWELYHSFYQRAINEMAVGWAAFDNPSAGVEGVSPTFSTASAEIEGASPGYNTTSPGPTSSTPGYYSISSGFDRTTAGTGYTTTGTGYTTTGTGYPMAQIDSAIMTRIDNTSAGSGGAPYGSDSTYPGFNSTLPGFDSASAG
ncbi:hypothetical protein F4859DRAFT_384673 [Xylaria cf. heliscus]|nr:hypothetical protein F4859DRAFT_384673 [Xylaria cf. heliscus]